MIQLFTPQLEHTILDPSHLNKVAGISVSSTGIVHQVAWSSLYPSVFAITVSVPMSPEHSPFYTNQCQDESLLSHEV